MARARRDVDLVVRARNEASNVLTTITDALQRFNRGQRETQRTAPDTSTALDRIAQAYRSLTSGVGSGRVSQVIAQEISRARNEFERYQASLQASTQNLARYTSDSRRAADETRRLQAEVARAQGRLELLRGLGTAGSSTPAIQRQRQAVRELTQTLRAAEGEERRLAGALRRTTAELKRNADTAGVAEARYKSIQAAARGTAAALEEVGQRSRGTILRAFGEQRQVLSQTEALYRRNQAEATRLGRAMASVANPSRELAEAFTRAREATRAGAAELIRQRQALQQIRTTLRETGGDLEDFIRRQTRAKQILDQSRQSYRQYGTVVTQAVNANNRLAASQARVATTTRQTATETERVASSTRRAAAGTSALARAYAQLYGGTRQALSFTQRLRSEVLALITAYAGLFAVFRGVGNIAAASQTLQTVTNRLLVVFNQDQGQVASELDFLRRTAQRLGIEFGVLANEYSKFAVATQNTNLQGEATRKIFIAVTEAARVQGLSMEQVEGTFVALTQIVSKGVVSMEELRRQLGDRLPGAIQIMADALNITTAELISLVSSGQLASDALLPFAEELRRRFGGQLPAALDFLAAGIGRFQDAVFRAFLRIGQGGAIDGFTDALNRLAGVLNSAQVESTLDRIGVASGAAAQALAVLGENFDVVITIIAFLVGRRFAPIVIALIASLARLPGVLFSSSVGAGAFATQMRAVVSVMGGATVATNAFAFSLRALLSTTGIGLLVAAIATGISLWVTRTDEVVEAQNEHLRVVDQLKNAYDVAGDSVQRWRNEVEGVTGTEIQHALSLIRREVSSLEEELRTSVIPSIFDVIFGADTIGNSELRRQLIGLNADFKGGRIDGEQYRTGIDRLTEAYRGVSPEIVSVGTRLIDLSRNLDDARRRGLQLESFFIALLGPLGKAGDALRGVTTIAESEAARLERQAEAFEQFGTAVRSFQENLPGGEEAADRLADEQAIEQQYRDLLRLADAAGASRRVVETLYQEVLRFRDAERIFEGAGTGLEASARLLRETTDLLGPEIARVAVQAQQTLIRVLGEGTVAALTAQQQAVLTSIIQTYGELSAPLAEAVRQGVENGSTAGVRSLVAALSDLPQAGLQAAIFGGGTFDLDAVVQSTERLRQARERENARAIREQERLAEAERRRQERARQATAEQVDDLQFQIQQEQRLAEGREREVAIQEALRNARRENADIGQEELNTIQSLAGALFDITNQGDEREAQLRRIEEAEQRVNALVDLRSQLEQESQAVREGDGDPGRVAELRQQIETLVPSIRVAVQEARVLVEAFGESTPEIDALLSRLRTLEQQLVQTGNVVKISLTEVFMDFSQGASSSLGEMVRLLEAGEASFTALRDIVRRFFAEFLLNIAQAIAQQAIFNALQGAFGGGGIIGTVAGIVATAHDGGRVTRQGLVPPSAGRSGLSSDEAVYVLQTGEEVLARDDPRNSANGAPTVIEPKIINVLDPADVLAAALSDSRGGEVFVNYVTRNRRNIGGVLG